MLALDNHLPLSANDRWLQRYYLTRAVFSVAWVAAALTLGVAGSAFGTLLLVIYPLWDAAANYVDAARQGGLARNRTQTLNVIVSLATTLAVVATAQIGSSAILAVFGAWAVLSGLLQLGTAVGRWKSASAQWAMVLSGAQSALAGVFFILQVQQPVAAVIPTVAGYAAFGAIYFFVSAIWLVVGKKFRRNT